MWIQRLSLADKRRDYRPVTVLPQRAGWAANRKRVQRIWREDYLLCVTGRTFPPAMTDSRHQLKTWPNLSLRLWPSPADRLLGSIYYLHKPRRGVYLLSRCLGCLQPQGRGRVIADHLRAELALAALEVAVARRAARLKARWRRAECAGVPRPCIGQGLGQIVY